MHFFTREADEMNYEMLGVTLTMVTETESKHRPISLKVTIIADPFNSFVFKRASLVGHVG